MRDDILEIAEQSRPVSSRLFTIPQDVLENLLRRMTKRDAFRLSQTCKSFMWHPALLKAIFHEPISISEIQSWYGQLPDTKMVMGPPVTWGINAFTGPFVRRLAVPEWTSEQDIHYLTAHCPNLNAIDLTEIFETVNPPTGWYSDDSDDLYSALEEEEGEIRSLPSMLNRCPALFRNLRSIHLPYGFWNTIYSRRHSYQQSFSAGFPSLLHLADHLQSLELTCQQGSALDPSPGSRRKASAKLLKGILDNVSRRITTLALYDSESTIENLDSFLQSLAIFPKLRTIKLSLHRDLLMYQRNSQPTYGFDSVIHPILSSLTKEYEHDTASVIQYLSTIKRINDRGRFSLVSSDCGEAYHSTPREYYGLCHTKLVHGPRNDLWTPVWTWNDRLHWVEGHQDHPSVEVVDIGKCRALFEELIKACIPVSVELEPLVVPFGAFFAGPWEAGISYQRYSDEGDVVNAHYPFLPGNGAFDPIDFTEHHPKQHFIERRVLTSIEAKNIPLYYGVPTGFDDQPFPTASVDLATFGDKLTYGRYRDNFGFVTPAQMSVVSPKNAAPQKKQRNISKSIAKTYITSATSGTTDTKTESPDPIWRLNEIGDLVDDLRLVWQRSFAYVYTGMFTVQCDPNPDWPKWSRGMQKCKTNLRARLWREAEYTALLFRRIPVDFPRLTRLALYIPAALYPDHDQTFINHVLPGTGWTVKHCGPVGGTPPIRNRKEAYLKIADEICPFIRRIFTRPAPTDDPSAVIVHDDEWHITKRPQFDLDGEYKSMDQLLTEPLRNNYTKGTTG